MRWGLILVLCGGCHLIIDPDDHVGDTIDAGVDAGTDARVDDVGPADTGSDARPRPDAGGDAGTDCGPPPMGVPMAPPCCYVDEDCPTDGAPLVCHGGMCGGTGGVCFPAVMGTTGSNCFLDTDCMSGTCIGGPNCGCQTPCTLMMPLPGVCM